MLATRYRPGVVALFASTIFLSAFLLFQVQPLLSKYILPWFGGTPAVWTTCMLFFQTVLFAGYAYAHLGTRLSVRGQRIVHAGLLLSAALLLPITPSAEWKPTGAEDPALRIILLLTATIGLPFFLLSSTGPLLQSWFARARPQASWSPYRLYALSNVGSLLALLSYPVLFEPAFDITVQAKMWSWGFAAFALLCAGCAWCSQGEDVAPPRAKSRAEEEHLDQPQEPTVGARCLWFGLSMAASVMLLATTNQVCQDVASVPFLWVIPLTLYLMTFILCFDSDRWYSRKYFAITAAVSIAAVCVLMLRGAGGPLVAQVLVYFGGLFFCAMVCHGELVKLKPATRHLTSFYLVIAAGGAAGGLFVAIIAPLIFPLFLEMHVALFGVAALAVIVFLRDNGWPLTTSRPRWAVAGMLGGMLLLFSVLRLQAAGALNNSVDVARNFYGVLRIQELDPGDPKGHRLRMVHGRVLHGVQFFHPFKRHEPTAYFGRASGAGLLLHGFRRHRPRYVGVVGLGVGTLAAYARPGDRFRFYEINPDVVRLAQKHFTYLKDCRGTVEIVTADARLALEREPPQQFDVLVIDAFSGDAIPAHLLTLEAFEIYRRHLKPDGVLAFNISNMYFDLRPVVAAAAKHLGWQAISVYSEGNDRMATKAALWMVLSPDLDRPELQAVRKRGRACTGPVVKWTDTDSNLIGVLK